MNVFEQLEGRLDATEKRIVGVVESLERMIAIEQALGEASKGLAGSNARVQELATGAQATVDALTGALRAFREAVTLLQKTDLARLQSELESVSKRLDALAAAVEHAEGQSTTDLERLASEARETTSKHANQLREAIGSAMDGITVQLREVREAMEGADMRLADWFKKEIHDVAKKASEDVDKQLRPVRSLVVGTLVVALVTLGVVVYATFGPDRTVVEGLDAPRRNLSAPHPGNVVDG